MGVRGICGSAEAEEGVKDEAVPEGASGRLGTEAKGKTPSSPE